MFSCEFWEISKNTSSYRTPLVAASGHWNSHYFYVGWAPMLTFIFWRSYKDRSSRPDVFCKKRVLRNFAKFTGKHLCQRPRPVILAKRDSGTGVFMWIFREISKKTFYYRTPLVAVSYKKLFIEFFFIEEFYWNSWTVLFAVITKHFAYAHILKQSFLTKFFAETLIDCFGVQYKIKFPCHV